MKRKKFKLVRVYWLDSNSESGWTRTICNKNTKCVSVGYLLAKNKQALTLTANLTKERDIQRCGSMTIPRVAITKIETLRDQRT